MIKKLLTSLLLTLLFLATPAVSYASGKMEVEIGEKVVLQLDSVQAGTDYKWIAKKGKEIIVTQTSPIFNYTFNIQGEYEVNLTVTDQTDNVKTSTINVLVGNRYTRFTGTSVSASGAFDTPLRVYYQTLPPLTPEKSVRLAGESGRVVYDIEVYRSDVIEYRIDRNIYIDSDGNGIANDDIDNADDSSYLIGGVWGTTYEQDESNKIVSEITVVNKEGEKAKAQTEIIFDDLPSKEGEVTAVLDTSPPLNPQDNRIHVFGESDTVAFYAGRSTGDIAEYRIDKNIFSDSDGDGNPANDIDNRQDKSFRTGDVWAAEYERTDEQIIAQLIVVGRGGTGSRVQREIVFREAPPIQEPGDEEETVIALTADKEFVQKGDPITFSVTGLTQDVANYTFEWDFDADGETDKTVEGDNTMETIYEDAGVFTVNVTVTDLDGNTADFQLDVLVRDTAETAADFEYDADGLTVDFTNLSTPATNLANKSLSYEWSFGETDTQSFESQRDQTGLENPQFTYAAPGTYVVTLTVTDADQVTDTTTQEVILAPEAGDVVDEAAEGGDADQTPDGTDGSGGGFIGTLFKVILYILLFVIVLILLIVIGLLAFLKIQHPDLVFEELIDELKIKILSVFGIHEHEARDQEADSQDQHAPEPKPAIIPDEAPSGDGGQDETASAEDQSSEAKDSDENATLDKQDAPIPDWMKKTEPAKVEPSDDTVVEGEVVEDEPAPKDQPAPESDSTSESKEEEIDQETHTDQEVPAEHQDVITEGDMPAPSDSGQSTEDEGADSGKKTQDNSPSAAPQPSNPPQSGDQEDSSDSDGGDEDLPKDDNKPLNTSDGPVPDWLKNAQ